MAGITLEVRRHILCWPINIIASCTYLYLFYIEKLYADALLQVLFIVMSCYGWLRWSQVPKSWVPTSRPLWQYLVQLCVSVAFSLVIGRFLSDCSEDPAPYLDALLTTMSVLATWWMACRLRPAWLLWVAVNGAYVGLFLIRELHMTSGLYLCFMILSVVGWFRWQALPPPVKRTSIT